MPVMIQGRRFILGHHVIDRFWSRECSQGSRRQASRRLVRLLTGPDVMICLTLPAWVRAAGLAESNVHADEFITVNEEFLFPVKDGVLKTCLRSRRVGAQIRIVGL